MMASRIFGRFFISSGIAERIPSISFTISSAPAPMIFSRFLLSASQNFTMMSGAFWIRTGSARTIPSAIAIMISIPISTMASMLFTAVSTRSRMPSTRIGISSGRLSAIPFPNCRTMSIPCCRIVGSVSAIPRANDPMICTPASTKSGPHSDRHSNISVTQEATAPTISGAPSAIPCAIFPASTIAVVQISSAQLKRAVTSEVTRPAAASPTPVLLFKESQKELTRPVAAVIRSGAAPATRSAICASTSPKAVTIPSRPPSSKESWSCPTIPCASIAMSFSGVCTFS